MMTEKQTVTKLQVNSPGRINLIGEHIDYNGGHVLPAAINRKLTLHFERTANNLCKVSSEGAGSFEFDISQPLKISNNHWENYVLGVVAGLNEKRPNLLKGFTCSISSDLPLGAGISSSAALECGVAKGLNDLFELNLTDLELVEISRKAEHNYVGTKCGVMDQFAVVMGKEKNLLLLNCETLAYKLIPADLKSYKLLLLNTNVSHNLASSEYNTRRAECEQAMAVVKKNYPEYTFLADVPAPVIADLKDDMDALVFKRALFVSKENQRTLEAAERIEKGEVEAFGALMYETHEGLSKDYEVSCPELDFLVDFSKRYPEVVGSRMMGGGFGGCTINLVQEDFVETFKAFASEVYLEKFGIQLTPIQVEISDGVQIIK